MHNLHKFLLGLLVSLSFHAALAQEAPAPAANIQVALVVPAGAPLRVYITRRLRMRKGEPVTAKLIEPVYAFDRIVLPKDVELQGHVTVLDPVSKMRRAQAVLGGDFTPLHFARVEFTTAVMSGGETKAIHVLDSEGMSTIYSEPRPSKKTKAAAKPGILGTAREQVQQQINSRTQGVIDLVRGPNKKEWLEDFLIKKMPYHPQWYRRNTRFDAVLQDSMDFGFATVSADAVKSIGLPTGESVAQVRLTTPLSSADADTNTKVQGVLSQPIFSANRQLLLPEGTFLSGRVRRAQPARWFHRGGQLRFTFDRMEPPAWTSLAPIALERREVQLANAEGDPRAHLKIDSEGNAKATEPKSRLLGPAIALIVAGRAADNDAERGKLNGGGDSNYGGRTAGGFSGFGLLGSAAAQASKPLGAALGYYGLAWSVYSTIISRGNEVEFEKNAAIEVRFPAPQKP